MGIIKRQGFKNAAVNYVGVLIATISTLLIYTREKELYGLYQFLLSSATLLSPFIALGASNVAVRFHPKNQERPEVFQGFLSFILGLIFVGSIIALAIFLGLKDSFYALFIKKGDDPLLKSYVLWAFPVAVLVALNSTLFNYISNFGRIVVPEIINKLWYKIALPVLILLVAAGWLSIRQYVFGMLAMMLVSTLTLLVYLFRLKGLDLRFPRFLRDRSTRREIINYGLFAILNAVSSTIVVKIDTIMVGKMIDLTNAGAYTILVFLINIMLIPKEAIFKISGPIVARDVGKREYEEVGKIYRSSSLILLVLGAVIFCLIVLNIRDLIAVLPDKEEFQGFFATVVFLGLAKLFDMTTSLNSHIIIYSPYYRFNLYALLVLAVLNVILNYVFIGMMGVSGAALATMISLTAYNLVKLFYIQYRFGMQPFTLNTLKVTAIGLAAFFAVFFLPKTGLPLLDMVIRTAIFTPLFALPVWYLQLVPELNELGGQLWWRVRKFLP